MSERRSQWKASSKLTLDDGSGSERILYVDP